MYLPYSSIYPWGGDAWRHIGIESKIQDGEQILPVLVGNDAEWVEVVGIDLPKVLVYPQKYTYTQFWASVVVVNEVMQSDLIFVHRWLGPFVWSLVMPLLLFRIGRLLFGSRRKGLWLPWLMFLFFPFQALGGLTLPVSLGYLTFFFVIMMWLQYVRDGLPWQKRIALLFSVLMVFGYTLHFILIWLLILFTLVVRRIAKIEKTELQYTSFAGLFLLSWFVFPVIELVGKMSFVPEKIEWWNNLKQLIGQFFGWFYASSIRPHDILSGNILFNHTPGWAFVPSIFNSWRWWIIPLMILIILATKFAFFQAWKPKSEFKWKMVILFTGTVVGSYIISWFVLEGDRSLVRRMDLFLTLAIAVLLIYTIQYFLVKLDLKKLYTRIIILIGIFALSWFGALAYASGPDLRVVDHNEYIAANHIWDEMGQEKPYCVLADTWPLLVLEGVSGREVVGGGFPIDNQFAQPERVDLFTKLINREVIDLEWMGELTGAEKCWFLRKRGESEELDEESGEVWINNFVVWEQGLKKVVK